MVDEMLLEEKLKLLAEYIADLEEQKHISRNELLRRYVERTLHLAAVKAQKGIKSPKTAKTLKAAP
ncbi:MAG: hypothetical protein HPY58_10335 [Firmicutes bacterium]|nr:hypothetical protein [Bacillota bacterium]